MARAGLPPPRWSRSRESWSGFLEQQLGILDRPGGAQEVEVVNLANAPAGIDQEHARWMIELAVRRRPGPHAPVGNGPAHDVLGPGQETPVGGVDFIEVHVVTQP